MGPLKVEPAPSEFTITVNGSPLGSEEYGSSATLAESGLPSGAHGTVAFASGGTALCVATLPGAGSCTAPATLAAGSYADISARFTDTDGNYTGETSKDSAALTVQRRASVIAISSSSSPAAPYAPLTLTANVDSSPAARCPDRDGHVQERLAYAGNRLAQRGAAWPA